MRISISILLITSSVLIACTDQSQQEPADLVLLNGGIYTVDPSRSWATAAAIRDGIIVAVGRNVEIQAFVGDATEVINLNGRMAMPGIHDSHVHPLEGGYEQVYCNLWDESGVDAIIARLQACEDKHEGEWFEAVGLDLGSFGLTGPDKSILDSLSQDKYIFVDGSDGHAALVNDKVLRLIGTNEDSLDPHDGVIERRAGSREPNGTLRESAREAADAARPTRTLEVSVPALRDAIKLMNSHGITSVYDVWIRPHELDAYQALDDAGQLNMRVLGGIYDAIESEHLDAELQLLIQNRSQFESDNISYDAIKLIVDGVLEGETAALLEPYLSVDHAGLAFRDTDVLNARVKHYYDMGLKIHFHAMGDRAVREAMDAIEYARDNGTEELKNTRHTISHMVLVDPSDMHRFAELNIGASVTMVWATSDEWAYGLDIPAMGLERVKRFYPIRAVHAAGGKVLGGSDWNYGDLDPLLSIETAVTREDPWGATPDSEYEVIGPDQVVDLETMIDAYTINGAWQIHAEDVSGSIEVGKRADIAIYDRNLFEIHPYEISEAQVDMTIFDGRVVYRRVDEQ
ncbi:MAG: amidohydrolase [Woeseiaceae bacterium]